MKIILICIDIYVQWAGREDEKIRRNCIKVVQSFWLDIYAYMIHAYIDQ